VAKMQIGFTPRLGIAGRDGTTDIVTGIVLKRKGRPRVVAGKAQVE
jgi:heavy metal efflux system protein